MLKTNKNWGLKCEHDVSRHHAHLSKTEKLALFGDLISHTGDIAGPVTFVIDLATNNAIPRWGKALVQCGATLFGCLSSLANVRTCKDAMLEKSEHISHSHHHCQHS